MKRIREKGELTREGNELNIYLDPMLRHRCIFT